MTLRAQTMLQETTSMSAQLSYTFLIGRRSLSPKLDPSPPGGNGDSRQTSATGQLRDDNSSTQTPAQSSTGQRSSTNSAMKEARSSFFTCFRALSPVLGLYHLSNIRRIW
jgi:hypothetical protein